MRPPASTREAVDEIIPLPDRGEDLADGRVLVGGQEERPAHLGIGPQEGIKRADLFVGGGPVEVSGDQGLRFGVHVPTSRTLWSTHSRSIRRALISAIPIEAKLLSSRRATSWSDSPSR